MRQYSQPILDALANNHATCYIIEMQLEGGTVRLTDAGRDIPFNGETYTANGLVLSVDSIQQRNQLRVQSLGIQFSAVDQTMTALLKNQNQLGRTVVLTKLIFDAQHKNPIGELHSHRYTINNVSEQDGVVGGGETTISVDLSNFVARWRAFRGLRTVQSSHQLVYPESTSFINSKDLKEVEWLA